MIDEFVLAVAASSAASTLFGMAMNWLRSKRTSGSEVDVTVTNSEGESVTDESKHLSDLNHDELVALVENLQAKLDERTAQQRPSPAAPGPA